MRYDALLGKSSASRIDVHAMNDRAFAKISLPDLERSPVVNAQLQDAHGPATETAEVTIV